MKRCRSWRVISLGPKEYFGWATCWRSTKRVVPALVPPLPVLPAVAPAVLSAVPPLAVPPLDIPLELLGLIGIFCSSEAVLRTASGNCTMMGYWKPFS